MDDNTEKSDQAAAAPLASDFIIPVLACALAAYYFVTTLDLVWEAKATGLFIGAVLVTLCAAHMVRMGLQIASRRASFSFGELFDNNLFNRQRLALLALVATFIATIQWVGTTLGLFLLLVTSMLVLGVRSIRVLAGIAFATSATVYVLLIYLLGSRLPQGPVEKLVAWIASLWGAA